MRKQYTPKYRKDMVKLFKNKHRYMTITAFAKKQGIDPSTFWGWVIGKVKCVQKPKKNYICPKCGGQADPELRLFGVPHCKEDFINDSPYERQGSIVSNLARP